MSANATEPEPGASTAIARELAPQLVHAGSERPITVDQTNRSIVVDETLIVKWFQPPRPVSHSDLHRGTDVLAHLAEVGFAQMPPFHGAHVVDGRLVASVAGFLAGAVDGWEWYLGELHAWIDGRHDRALLTGRATALGALAGRLHVALATPSSRFARPIEAVPVRSLHARVIALFERARDVTGGVTAAHLAPRWERIRAELDVLDTDRTTPAITVHGDLHVGNILAAGERLVVTDFDGNPIGDDDRPGPQPAAADLASLLQSIDHVGRIVDHRTDGARRADLTAFIDEAVEQALAAYRAELAAASLDHVLDASLLRPLRVAQELHELAYAAAHLPHWVYVPDATLTAMFPEPLTPGREP